MHCYIGRNGDAVIQHPKISITSERYYSKLFPTQFCLTRNNSKCFLLFGFFRIAQQRVSRTVAKLQKSLENESVFIKKNSKNNETKGIIHENIKKTGRKKAVPLSPCPH
jgi:hydroxymethylpyrimidine/phosphomethylpyrimidine kinase